MQDRPRPQPAAGEIEVAVQMAGVCGSDISGFLGLSTLRVPPLILGHELVGWLDNGRRVVANPLITCGSCDDCLTGAQNPKNDVRITCKSLSVLQTIDGLYRYPGAGLHVLLVPCRSVPVSPQKNPRKF